MPSSSSTFRPGPIKSFRDAASYCIEKLETNSFEAYLVGGTVRDIISGRIISDLDIATSARPDQVHKVFSDFKVLDTGIKHGTVTLILPAEDGGKFRIEITTYRVESTYSDARHPDEVSFTNSIEEDLARRDLTINAMAWHPKRGILDPYGGRKDLEAGILRALGRPEERFEEDALRILRTLRFAAVLGFNIEADTDRALIAARDRLKLVSAERLYVEFARLLTGAKAGQVIDKYWQVIAVFLPELLVLENCCIRKGFLLQLNELPARLADRMAYLTALVSFKEGFDSDKDLPASPNNPANSICRRLKCPGKLSQEILLLSDYLVTEIPADKLYIDKVRRQLALFGRKLEELLLLKAALGLSQVKINALRQIDRDLSTANLHGLKSLDIKGQDLVKIGFEGKAIGAALDKLYEAVVCDDLSNKKEVLLKRARTFLKTDN